MVEVLERVHHIKSILYSSDLHMENANIFIHPTADVSKNATIGNNVKIWHNAQIREWSMIGFNCIIGKNVYIDTGVLIGNNVKIQNNVSIYRGVTVEDGVFIGPHTCFTNDKYPRSINPDGTLKNSTKWNTKKTTIKYGASIGANATIITGITIGKFSIIGAGSVIAKDVQPFTLYYGNPATFKSYICKCGKTITENCMICKMTLPNE